MLRLDLHIQDCLRAYVMQKLLLDLALRFVLRQIGKFRDGIEWETLDADLQERARALLPGQWFDAEGAAFAHTVVYAVKGALDQTDVLELLLAAVAEKRWDDALKVLKDLLARAWAPKVLAGFKETGRSKTAHLQVVEALDITVPDGAVTIAPGAPKHPTAKGSRGDAAS